LIDITHPTETQTTMTERIAFIGGGNMASAIIGGLIRQGTPAQMIDVVEPFAEARAALQQQHGVLAQPQAGSFLEAAALVVWAVKPQMFRQAAAAVCPHTALALHLSVAAGIRTDSIAQWLGSERVVRAMPNTPALIGRGMTALFARATVTAADRARVDAVIATTGELLWLAAEEQLDAVTALSGSGPAYMFYFMEAMRAAGVEMGLPAEQAYQLAVATFIGAGELARASSEPPEVLRQRVTSPGGTTHAAISKMMQTDVGGQFIQAMHAARSRATEMGQEFGAA
jgi:pyrroline-5-carboxylate reductase